MKFLAIIPARYASTRFPGKPLAEIAIKPMIRHTWENSSAVFTDCWVATDDERILAAVEAFGGKAVMTSVDHQSGTDRCAEALTAIEKATGERFDVVVNVQGDEPFIAREQLEKIMSLFDDPDTHIATLVRRFGAGEDIFNPNSPKVVFDRDGFALYFSRSVIPYIRGVEKEEWGSVGVFYKHIGLYAFRHDVLLEVAGLPRTSLEKAESLEQLRWLESGYNIKVAETAIENISVDTPEDLEHANNVFNGKQRG